MSRSRVGGKSLLTPAYAAVLFCYGWPVEFEKGGLRVKFHQLSPGERFEYGGEPYRKTAPLLGTHEQTGQQRVIPRSAVVIPTGAEEPGTSIRQGAGAAALSAEAVMSALNDYHSACKTGLVELLEADQRKKAEAILDKARVDFCRTLSLVP